MKLPAKHPAPIGRARRKTMVPCKKCCTLPIAACHCDNARQVRSTNAGVTVYTPTPVFADRRAHPNTHTHTHTYNSTTTHTHTHTHTHKHIRTVGSMAANEVPRTVV